MKPVALILFTTFLLSACNTVEGVGKDLGKAGDAISDSAEKTKKKL